MSEPTSRQIALLRDIRIKGATNALLFSAFRSEGPGLREAGLIGGVGDSTHITVDGMIAVKLADQTLHTDAGRGGE